MSAEDAAELRRAAAALAQAAQELRAVGSSNTASITQHPGGSLVIACAMLVGMNVMLGVILVIIGLRTSDLDDKLSAIYMLAPHLKPITEAKP